METSSPTRTLTEPSRILFLRPPEEEKKVETKKLKPKPKKQVIWAEDTIDNENMNKLKSKSTKEIFFNIS